jgi:hypothetical protein
MKSIFLSIVVICALAIAGIGGTLAGFVDTEESLNNSLTTGSLDLKVSDGHGWQDDAPYGAGIPTLVTLTDVMPGKQYEKVYYVTDMGQALNPNGTPEPAYLYLIFKNMCCSNVNPTHPGPFYEDTNVIGAQKMKTEPEMVAEYGGKVDCQDVTSKKMGGLFGDGCCMRSHTQVRVYLDGVRKVNWTTLLDIQTAGYIYLGEIMPCGATHTIKLVFRVPQIEDMTWTGWAPLAYWPTNALQLDKVQFDIETALLQEKYRPD